jgi:ABC-2 type transport system ATP-binding protein
MAGAAQPAFSARGLTKRYGRTLALDDLTLDVPRGAVFGLLGPNGSGKSTFIKLLMGFIFPDSGEIVRGDLLPARIGYLPERPFFPPHSSLAEYLSTLGELGAPPGVVLQGSARQRTVSERLAQVGLDGVAQRPIRTCSRGMLQRLALATSLLGDPPLLLWDEPMGGLDPAWQKAVRDLIRYLAARGTTIVLSTHDLSEAEQLCSHVAFLHRGRLVRCGPLGQVLAWQPEVSITVDWLPAATAETLATWGPDVRVNEANVILRGAAVSRKAEALRLLLDAGADIRGLAQARTTLEQIYLEAVRS